LARLRRAVCSFKGRKSPKRGSERKQIRTEKGKREKSPPKGKGRKNERKSFWEIVNDKSGIKEITTLRFGREVFPERGNVKNRLFPAVPRKV